MGVTVGAVYVDREQILREPFLPEFSRRWWSKCDGLLSKSFLWNWKVFPGYGQSDKKK